MIILNDTKTTPPNDELRMLTEVQIPQLITILKNAYPSLQLHREDARNLLQQRVTDTLSNPLSRKYFGLFRDHELLGVLRHDDFQMRFVHESLRVAGLGMVAVDFLHKKQKVAKSLVSAWLEHCREEQFTFAALYAFRTDFYYAMGFGFGPQMYQYHLSPSSFPQDNLHDHVRFVHPEHRNELLSCYSRIFRTTHGLMKRSEPEFTDLLQREDRTVVGYWNEETIEGYLIFSFQSADSQNFGVNNMVIHEFMYENKQALMELFSFLHSQSDQIRTIVLTTQDDNFYHLIPDARNQTDNLIPHVYHETNTSGVGLMYRVIDPKQWFKSLSNHSFGGQTCQLKITLEDDFLPMNAGSFIVHFASGYATVQTETANFDVEIRIDIANFSSLVMGVITFKKLLLYGKAEISRWEYANIIQALFLTDEKPVCLTGF